MLLNQIALALWLGGQPDQGQAAWRRSVKLDPTDLTARVNLATSFYELRQVEAAELELLAGLYGFRNSRRAIRILRQSTSHISSLATPTN